MSNTFFGGEVEKFCRGAKPSLRPLFTGLRPVVQRTFAEPYLLTSSNNRQQHLSATTAANRAVQVHSDIDRERPTYSWRWRQRWIPSGLVGRACACATPSGRLRWTRSRSFCANSGSDWRCGSMRMTGTWNIRRV